MVHLLDATMFWNPTGGVRRYLVAKRDWLQRHTDWRHTVATPTPDTDADLRVPSLPLLGSGGAYRLPWRRGVTARLLVAQRPNLIESADPYLLAWASLDAARTLHIPAVAFCHSDLEQLAALAAGPRHAGAAMRAARRYTKHVYARFDRVLAPSRALVAQLHDGGVAHARHQPLGVDTQVFHPTRRDPAWRATLGLPADARLLVYTGRFAPEKRLDTLVQAVQRLGAPYWLIAIGTGRGAPRGARVRVLPPEREPELLARAIASADAFVHAGDQETFGLSALEALACGVPVVARAAGGLRELVDHGVGRTTCRGTAEDFADAVADLFACGTETLRAAARQRAVAQDWNRVLPALWQHYRGLLGQNRLSTPNAITQPIAAPTTTSLGKCNPSTTRDAATKAANGHTTHARPG